MKSTADVRREFLAFFRDRDHLIFPSASLVPRDPPNLSFTTAGMVQFLAGFTGTREDLVRAASCQRCLRVDGRFNDIDLIGYAPRHHCFFEMLGNFSFGDYFKREAIQYAWEFLIEHLQLDPTRLMATVYEDDDEAFGIWTNDVGLPPAKVARIGSSDTGGSANFWELGDSGPCGPCSEILYDFGPGVGSDRWVELWNLVFMQFNRAADGTLTALPRRCVDGAAGLERIAAAVQGVESTYDIDVFVDLKRRIHAVVGERIGIVDLRLIADHARAAVFLIVDGVAPANCGRGAVLRTLIQRASLAARRAGTSKPCLFRLAFGLAKYVEDAFPEIAFDRETVEAVLEEEERLAFASREL